MVNYTFVHNYRHGSSKNGEVPETADKKLAFAKKLAKYGVPILDYSRNIKESQAKYKNHINSNNNTHIAALAPLPLTTHPRSWAKLLTFGPKCTLPF